MKKHSYQHAGFWVFLAGYFLTLGSGFLPGCGSDEDERREEGFSSSSENAPTDPNQQGYIPVSEVNAMIWSQIQGTYSGELAIDSAESTRETYTLTISEKAFEGRRFAFFSFKSKSLNLDDYFNLVVDAKYDGRMLTHYIFQSNIISAAKLSSHKLRLEFDAGVAVFTERGVDAAEIDIKGSKARFLECEDNAESTGTQNNQRCRLTSYDAQLTLQNKN